MIDDAILFGIQSYVFAKFTLLSSKKWVVFLAVEEIYFTSLAYLLAFLFLPLLKMSFVSLTFTSKRNWITDLMGCLYSKMSQIVP